MERQFKVGEAGHKYLQDIAILDVPFGIETSTRGPHIARARLFAWSRGRKNACFFKFIVRVSVVDIWPLNVALSCI